MSEETNFAAALELPPSERAAYLAKTCGEDGALRKRLEGLLSASERAGHFMARPAVASAELPSSATEVIDGNRTPTDATITRDGPVPKTDDDLADLAFLSPSNRPDSLGRIGHYEVLEVLGKGGFGIVFRAFDDVLQRVVAVKVMAPQLAATSPARKRFLREARSSAQVRHENVVQVYEIGEQPLPYLAMEFIPGETLQQRLDRTGPLEAMEVVRIGRQIAEGLAAAHATDLVHRDIKPSNILIEVGQQKVKLTDFGLARAADDASISQSGIIAGTPMFMAPEQALGHKLDQRADLFSLGSVLYQMTSGRPPFRANNTVAVLKRVAEDKPRDIREIIPETPQWLCNIIAKLHEKKPEDRYQTAREVADVLGDCEQQLKVHGSLKDFSRIPGGKPHRPRRRVVAAAAAILMIPLLALAVTEMVGFTHLLRTQQPVVVEAPPVDPDSEASSAPAAGRFALAFDGKSSVVMIPSLRITENHALTVEAWTVLEQPIDQPKLYDLVGNPSSSGFVLNADANSGHICFVIRLKDPDHYVVARQKQLVPRNQLVHLAGVYDGNGEIRFYIDGQLQSRTPAPDIKPSTSYVTLGNNRERTSAFLGRMNGVRVSKVARYDADFTPTQHWKPDADTIALYHFDEGQGNVLKDSSGNGHHGEIIRAKWVKADGSTIGSSDADGWVQLFNGKDLTGWKGLPDLWRIEGDDVIGATANPKGSEFNTFLISPKNYQNFELRFQVRLKGEQGNTGFQFRSKVVDPEKFVVHGPQVDIGRGYWSALYMEGPPWRVRASAPAEVVARTIKPLGFNEFYVRCVGKHLTVKFNGDTTIDEDFPEFPDNGVLALQIHKGTPIEATFRKIEIRELPPSSPEVPKTAADVLPYLAGNWMVERENLNPDLPPDKAVSVGYLTYDYVVGGNVLRARGDASRDQSVLLHTYDRGQDRLQLWQAYSNGISGGPTTGAFNPASRTLTWTYLSGAGTPQNHEFTFTDADKFITHMYYLDKKNNIVRLANMKFTRIKEPVTIPILPTDPQRPSEMKVLDRLVGDWRDELTVKQVAAPGKDKPETVRVNAQPILGGRFIEVIETNETKQTSDYWLVWFDAQAKKYRTWYFRHTGEAGEPIVEWNEAAKTLTWNSAVNRLMGRYVFTSDDLREVGYFVRDTDGKILTEATGVSRRAKLPILPDSPEQVLPALAGVWKGEYTQKIYGGKPDVKKTSAVAVNDWIVGQKWLRQRVQMANEGFQSITAYEPGATAFRDYFFHSRGLIFGPSTGRWEPATRTMTWTNLPEAGIILLMTLRFVDADTISGEILIRDKDGKTLFEISSLMKRTTENIAIDEDFAAGPLPPEMKVLDRLVGDWQITGLFKDLQNPDGLKVMWQSTSGRILGGRFLYTQYADHPFDKENYSLFTFDSSSKAYSRWLFKADGSVLEYGGGWDEKTQTMKWNWAGRDGSQRSNTWQLANPDRLEWQVLTKDALGKTTFDLQATSVRLKKPPQFALSPFNADRAKELQDAWAKHLGVQVEFENSVGMKMRLIPPGEFMMGTSEETKEALLKLFDASKPLPISVDYLKSEPNPKRTRIAEPFYAGVFEVTNAQFRKFVAATGHKTDGEKSGDGGWSRAKGGWERRPEHLWTNPGPWEGKDDHPVVHVSYDDAMAFCEWLSKEEGRRYTLPDEARWEFAARAGTTGLYGPSDQRHDLYAAAWFNTSLLENMLASHPQPVGGRRANAFGLNDMLGNVWEWCSDELEHDPGKRVLRGGSWYCIDAHVRVNVRGGGTPNKAWDAGTGFRVIVVGDLKEKTTAPKARQEPPSTDK